MMSNCPAYGAACHDDYSYLVTPSPTIHLTSHPPASDQPSPFAPARLRLLGSSRVRPPPLDTDHSLRPASTLSLTYLNRSIT